MKNILIAAGLAAATIGITATASADSLRNFSEASADASEASARIVAAGGQVALGAVAVPLAAVGSVAEGAGNAANTIANDMWATANAPLVVDDDVVVAQPAPVVSETSTSEEQDQ